MMYDNVKIYGGFDTNDTKLSDRDWLNNKTILSGDIDENDDTDPDMVVTSTAGGAQLRTFSREDIAAWFREDEIAEGTRAVGEKLLTDLRNERQ